MARNVVIGSLILFLLLGSLILGVKAVTYQAGVAKGDTFYYDYSTSPHHDDAIKLLNIQYEQLEITNVASPIVYFTIGQLTTQLALINPLELTIMLRQEKQARTFISPQIPHPYSYSVQILG